VAFGSVETVREVAIALRPSAGQGSPEAAAEKAWASYVDWAREGIIRPRESIRIKSVVPLRQVCLANGLSFPRQSRKKEA
jgi:hypothetical protein